MHDVSSWKLSLQAALPPALVLCTRQETHLDGLAALYADTRAEELATTSWPAAQIATFLHSQFSAQHQHYLQHYPNAQWWVIEDELGVAGLIYVSHGVDEVRLMEIALARRWRGQGLGRRLVDAILQHADETACAATLHVEANNFALGMYERSGFSKVEQRGPYWFMRRPAQTASPLAEPAADAVQKPSVS